MLATSLNKKYFFELSTCFFCNVLSVIHMREIIYVGVFVGECKNIFQEHSHLLMLYGRSIKFYKPLILHYYGSKEEGEESSQEGSKEEEEGIVLNSSTNKKTHSWVFLFPDLCIERTTCPSRLWVRRMYHSYTPSNTKAVQDFVLHLNAKIWSVRHHTYLRI